jgi:hypothetical protein
LSSNLYSRNCMHGGCDQWKVHVNIGVTFFLWFFFLISEIVHVLPLAAWRGMWVGTCTTARFRVLIYPFSFSVLLPHLVKNVWSSAFSLPICLHVVMLRHRGNVLQKCQILAFTLGTQKKKLQQFFLTLLGSQKLSVSETYVYDALHTCSLKHSLCKK